MIAVTVRFINKRAAYLFWKRFSKNLLLPIVAYPSWKLNLVMLQLKPSRTIWFSRSDTSKYLLNPKCLIKLSCKSRTWSRSVVFCHETLRTLAQHTTNKGLQAHWIPAISPNSECDWLKLPWTHFSIVYDGILWWLYII